MSVMPEDERQAHMNTDEFRNRFSPDERRIVGNLAEVCPSGAGEYRALSVVRRGAVHTRDRHIEKPEIHAQLSPVMDQVAHHHVPQRHRSRQGKNGVTAGEAKVQIFPRCSSPAPAIASRVGGDVLVERIHQFGFRLREERFHIRRQVQPSWLMM